MENRITSLLLPLVLVVGGFLLIGPLFNKNKKNDASNGGGRQARAEVKVDAKRASRIKNPAKRNASIRMTTGQPGDTGFILQFDNAGASLRSVLLLNEWRVAGLSEEEKQDEAQLYPIVEDLRPGTNSFVAEDFLWRFPIVDESRKDDGTGPHYLGLHQVPWQYEKTRGGNGLLFRLELESGITFEREYLFPKGSRSITLVQRVLNTNADLGGTRWTHWLRGAFSVPHRASGSSFETKPVSFGVVENADGTIEPKYLPADGKPNPRIYPNVFRVQGNERALFAGSSNAFFAVILRPTTEASTEALRALALFKMPALAQPKIAPYSNACPLLTLSQTIPEPKGGKPGKSEIEFDIYMGPKSKDVFEDPEHTEYAEFTKLLDIDLAQGTCFCAPGAQTFSKLMLAFLKFIYGILGNWGFSILLLTLIVRALLSPLNLKQAKTMRGYQDRMAVLKPKMDAIKEKYKKNQQKMNQELMKFQKENKLFPPLMGCLPLFFSFPVFIGLFMMLRTSYDLFHQPFLGWIQDLSQPDRLFRIGETGIPLVPEYFNLLPIIMMILWGVNAFRTKMPDDPKQKTQAKMMRFMPFLFGIMLYNYASGLALYMCMSAAWTLIEQTIVRRRLGVSTTMMTPM